MAEWKMFAVSVGSHYAALGTGGIVVFLLAIADQVLKWHIPKWLYLILLGTGLLVSCFQAWRDQYMENETGRSAGSFVLRNVNAELAVNTPQGNTEGEITLELVLANTRDRLMQYQVDKFQLVVESVPAPDAPEVFANKGGYAYPTASTVFRGPRFKVPLKQPLAGNLEYAISYNSIGSTAIHHTKKSLVLECWLPNSIDGAIKVRFTTLKEYED